MQIASRTMKRDPARFVDRAMEVSSAGPVKAHGAALIYRPMEVRPIRTVQLKTPVLRELSVNIEAIRPVECYAFHNASVRFV